MFSTARAVTLIALAGLPLSGLAQTGPSEPQVITAASSGKINVGTRKLAGYLVGTVRVQADGRVSDVRVVENTTESGFEEQLIRVLRATRFRPAIDENGRVIEGNVELKIELRSSTGNTPKAAPARSDPQQTEQEKARIRRMKCRDFIWEWDLIREEAGDAVTGEFMPRIATAMYATQRTEAGDYVDAKVWKASPKGLREAVDRCRDAPDEIFWEGVFKPIMDEAVPK